MSFRIFASGTGGYSRTETCPDEGDVFDADTLISLSGAAVTGGARGAAQEYATDQATPDSNLQRALSRVGTMQATRALETNFVLTLARAHQIQISVYARSSSMLPFWPDNSGQRSRMYRSNDGASYRRFLGDVSKVLKDADLNRFMVLFAIGHVISDWGGLASNGTRMLNFEITAV